MVTRRSGSVLRVTATSVLLPSSMLYASLAKLAVTVGSSLSPMVPVAARVVPPPARDAPSALDNVRMNVSSSASSSVSSMTVTETVWETTELATKVSVPLVDV